MKKRIIISALAVVLIITMGIGLLYLFAKGYPVGDSTREVSPFPDGIQAELSEISSNGGILTIFLTEERVEQNLSVEVDEPWNVYIEKKGKTGNWIQLAESKVPFTHNGGWPPLHLTQEITEIHVEWDIQYGALPRGEYRLLFRLYSGANYIWVAVPFLI